MRYTILIPLLFALGCNDGAAKVAEIKGLSDRACACKDKACADKVIADFSSWAEKNKESKGTDDDAKAAEAAATSLVTCAVTAGADPAAIAAMADKLK